MSNKKYRKARKKFMKQLVFEPYLETDVNAKSLTIWALLTQALNNPNWKIDSRDKLRKSVRLSDAFDALHITTKDDKGRETKKLKVEGCQIVLETDLFELLKSAWDAYYTQLPTAYAKEVLNTDDFLSNAIEVEPTAVKPV